MTIGWPKLSLTGIFVLLAGVLIACGASAPEESVVTEPADAAAVPSSAASPAVDTSPASSVQASQPSAAVSSSAPSSGRAQLSAAPASEPSASGSAPQPTTLAVMPGPTQPDPASSSQSTEQTSEQAGLANASSQATEEPEPDTSGNETTKQSTPQSSESDHVDYMVRLLAMGHVGEWWFLDLATISTDPELTPLHQNLTETWNQWNQDNSDTFGISFQDAAFAVSLPGDAVFLGGIEDVEGLRETVAGSGYQKQEIAGAAYWVNPDQDWQGFTFLPNGVVMIMDQDPGYFVQDVSDFIDYEFWDEDLYWQSYVDYLHGGPGDRALEIGSTDDVVAEIRNSLVFYFEHGERSFSLAKAGAGTLRQKQIGGFPDEESAKLEEIEFKERLAQLRASVEGAGTENPGEETAEQRLIREYLSACANQEVHRSGKVLTSTQVCRTDYIDLRFANYLLALQ